MFFILILFFTNKCFGQVFLNGSFESNTYTGDILNIDNLFYNINMPNSTSFGTKPNMDILMSDSFCGPAQHGNWYVALTGGGTDMISLTVSENLIEGRSYSVSFYDRMCPLVANTIFPMQIGLSTRSDDFGSLLYTTDVPDVTWSLRTFSFIAPFTAQYITVKMKGGGSFGSWTQVDNFSLSCAVVLDLGNDTLICGDNTLELRVPLPNTSKLWQDGSTNSTYSVTNPGRYWVEVDSAGCIGTDTINVGFENCSVDLFIPSGFTPNGDGRNDFFSITSFLRNFEMKIYNRWGELVFRTTNMQNGWDGRGKGGQQPAGVYIYLIRYRSRENTDKIAKGTVTLIR